METMQEIFRPVTTKDFYTFLHRTSVGIFKWQKAFWYGKVKSGPKEYGWVVKCCIKSW